MQNGRINSPQAQTSLVPKRKLNSINKTTGLWSEVSINKIRTRSITFISTSIISDNNSFHMTKLETSNRITIRCIEKIIVGNGKLVLCQRTINRLYLSFKQSLYIRAYIAETTCSTIKISLQSLVTFKVIFVQIKAKCQQGNIKDMSAVLTYK